MQWQPWAGRLGIYLAAFAQRQRDRSVRCDADDDQQSDGIGSRYSGIVAAEAALPRRNFYRQCLCWQRHYRMDAQVESQWLEAEGRSEIGRCEECRVLETARRAITAAPYQVHSCGRAQRA
ncbi:UNVERIFIED_CONTAM: hypothetical protein GTU68_010395 [Idotea baltica]|nr:hypothetical protein [Idotea baltica]